MVDLKSLLGDKYKDGMTIDELMALEVEEPQQIDMSKFVSKELYDKAASDTANYKKQLKASMSEAEQKAMADAEERKAISRAEAGDIVDIQEEGFICRIDNRIQLRNIDCEVLGERELTEEELKELDE